MLRTTDSLARCSSRSPSATARRHAPPPSFISNHGIAAPLVGASGLRGVSPLRFVPTFG
ncbi:hypothetical protein BN903_63 [Halorubrum sp. AJ67]|nr:hypothetical protein BN903_63 [Halorubrum sp. AJ67]